jgi:hypothetical protein
VHCTLTPLAGSAESVGDSRVEFHVLWSSVEAESSQSLEADRNRLFSRADQHHVEMDDADVVRVDLNLFHDQYSGGGAFELTPRSGGGAIEFQLCHRLSVCEVLTRPTPWR